MGNQNKSKIMELKLSDKIERLVTILKSQEYWKNDDIQELIENLSIQESDVASFQKFNHDKKLSYGREPIYTCPQFKLLLMSWEVADVTAIHNHGNIDWGGVLFFGDATHRLYEEQEESLTLIMKNIVPYGTFLPMKGSLIHLMSNQTNKRFTTMHLYGHNILLLKAEEKAIIYQPEFHKKVYTQGCAYVNIEESFVCGESSMPQMPKDDYDDYLSIVTPFYERIDTLHLLVEATK